MSSRPIVFLESAAGNRAYYTYGTYQGRLLIAATLTHLRAQHRTQVGRQAEALDIRQPEDARDELHHRVGLGRVGRQGLGSCATKHHVAGYKIEWSQTTGPYVPCTVFIQPLLSVTKLTRSQSLARSFYDTLQLVNKNRTRALAISI